MPALDHRPPLAAINNGSVGRCCVEDVATYARNNRKLPLTIKAMRLFGTCRLRVRFRSTAFRLFRLLSGASSGRCAFNNDVDGFLQHRPESSAFLPEDNVVIERARLEWTKLDGEGRKLARGKSIAARDAEARGDIVYLLADDIDLNCQMRLLAHVAQRIFVHLV